MQNNTTLTNLPTNASELEESLLRLAEALETQWDTSPSADFSDTIIERFQTVNGLTEATNTPESASALARVLWGTEMVPHEIDNEDLTAREALRAGRVFYSADVKRHPAHFLLLALVNAIHRDMETKK